MVFQAHPELAIGDVFLSQGKGAGANGVEFAAQVQNGVHDLDAGEGTKVFAAVADELTGGENAGEALFLDDNKRIGLVVFELDVVERLMFLDEAVLQQQRVGFGWRDEPLDVVDLGNEKPGLAVVVVLGEVARDALL